MSELDPNSSFHRLPRELVDKILVHGAESSSALSFSLLTTAKWTHARALPHLYSSIVIKKPKAATKFVQGVHLLFDHEHLPEEFDPEPCVQALWMEPVSSHVLTIFGYCHNLRRLALPFKSFFWLLQASTGRLGTTELRHCTINSKNEIEILVLDNFDIGKFDTYLPPPGPNTNNTSSPLWAKVTRLWLAECDTANDRLMPIIDRFTNLTHFALTYRVTSGDLLSPFVLDVLRHPSLTHLVIIIYSDSLSEGEMANIIATARIELSKYPRLLLLDVKSQSELQSVWEERDSSSSVWERAEAFTETLKVSTG